MATGNSLAMLPWFVRDYIAATRHLSLPERGAYTDLLFLSWEIGPLPSDPARLARLVGCGAEEFAQVWPTVSSKFTETERGLINPRLEEHRAEAYRRAQIVSDIARAKANKRWHGVSETRAATMPQQSNGSAPAMPQHCPSNAGAMHPSPSPSPSPDSGVLEDSDSRPRRARTRERPAYAQQEFHDRVIAAYHRMLPDLPEVRDWTKSRAGRLNARIRQALARGKEADKLDYWERLFAKVGRSDFLMGRKKDWRCPGLAWLVASDDRFANLVEGAYDNSADHRGADHAR